MHRPWKRQFQKILEILEKRNGQFPYSFSDQKYNDYIKNVCDNVTGHSSVVMFLNYIGKSNKDLEMEMGNYF